MNENRTFACGCAFGANQYAFAVRVVLLFLAVRVLADYVLRLMEYNFATICENNNVRAILSFLLGFDLQARFLCIYE